MKKNAEKIRKLGVFLTICVSAAVMVGCGKGQESEETEKLTVCTGSMQEYEVRKLVEAWQTMNDGIETEVIVVPSDDTLAETKITELRTEICRAADRMSLLCLVMRIRKKKMPRNCFQIRKKPCIPICFCRWTTIFQMHSTWIRTAGIKRLWIREKQRKGRFASVDLSVLCICIPDCRS